MAWAYDPAPVALAYVPAGHGAHTEADVAPAAGVHIKEQSLLVLVCAAENTHTTDTKSK